MARRSDKRARPVKRGSKSKKIDLLRLAMELLECTRPQEVLGRALRVLRADTCTTWAVLYQIERGKYEIAARGPAAHEDLRQLADAACGADTLLSVARTSSRARLGPAAWVAVRHPTAGKQGEPYLVLARWGASGSAASRSRLDSAAQMIAAALRSARAFGYLVELSCRDPLTGVLNRRGILEALQRERARAQRQDRPLSVLFLDLDRFKEINDRYGHLVGDEVLSTTAGLLSEMLRASDSVGRLGGDEFLIVLPDTNVDAASAIARRLVHQLGTTPLRLDQGTFAVGFSYGVSGVEESEGATLAGLIEQADRRMLTRKRRRRTETAVRPAATVPVSAGRQ